MPGPPHQLCCYLRRAPVLRAAPALGLYPLPCRHPNWQPAKAELNTAQEFEENVITTANYTWYNFVFLFLWEQFNRFANGACWELPKLLVLRSRRRDVDKHCHMCTALSRARATQPTSSPSRFCK